MAAIISLNPTTTRRTGFSREGEGSDDDAAVNELASSRLKPVLRNAFQPQSPQIARNFSSATSISASGTAANPSTNPARLSTGSVDSGSQ